MSKVDDYILENIRHVLRQKGIKEEYFAKQIGISQSEFSKILNGKRKNYIYLSEKITKTLEVSLHELTTPQVTNQSTPETDCISIAFHKEIIAICDERNYANQRTIELLKANMEKLQNKYDKLKAKLIATEEALFRLKNQDKN